MKGACSRVCAAAACTAAVLLLSAKTGYGVTIRTKADMRLWETVHDRSAWLSWPWEAAADSATLVFSNRLTGAVSTVDVARGAEETRGSCAQTPPDGEAIVDVTLAQTAAGGEVARATAMLAYVDGAGGGPITVRANPGSREWERVRDPLVYAVDPAWRGESGASGYDIAWPINAGLTIILR